MKKDPIKMYQEYVANNWDRGELIKKVVNKYNIKSVLYPGSYIHITPSLYVPKTTYVDLDKKAKAFFKDERVYAYINECKHYPDDTTLNYYALDYTSAFEEKMAQYDLLISQYAGFVSQACKDYLKVGGILIVNNSHGDAGMANIDVDYELISVVNQRDNNWIVSDKNLETYFILKKEISVTKEYLELLGRGIGYKKSASAYIFKKIKHELI